MEALHLLKFNPFQTFPDTIFQEYCGRSHLLLQIDSGNAVVESNELNNVHDKEFFMKCDGGQCNQLNVPYSL